MDYLVFPRLTQTKGRCNTFKELLLREELSITGFSKAVWLLVQRRAWPSAVDRGESLSRVTWLGG